MHEHYCPQSLSKVTLGAVMNTVQLACIHQVSHVEQLVGFPCQGALDDRTCVGGLACIRERMKAAYVTSCATYSTVCKHEWAALAFATVAEAPLMLSIRCSKPGRSMLQTTFYAR
jgi:hypothetical protein